MLEQVWQEDRNEFISMTAHSGTIAAILGAVGHRAFTLPTGGLIVVAVKGVELK